MPSSVLSVAISGLHAAQAGLATAGHNIANVNTAGYSRQEALQASRPGVFTGAGYLGRGVDVATVVRRYDALLATQARTAQSASTHHATAQAQAAAVDNLLADPDAGLAPALAAFFAGVNTVANHPGDLAARQSMLSAAGSLAARVRLLDGALAGRQQAVDRGIEAAVASANALARQVAELNGRINREAGRGQPPNDLLDRRDALVADLAKLAGVSTATQSDGSLNVFLANGQALVVGEQALALVAAPDRFDAGRRVPGLASGSGFVEFTADSLAGGELGGLVAARRDVLDPAQNALGRLVAALGGAVNAQHRLGLDRLGAPGGDLFGYGAPWVGAASSNAGDARLQAAFADTGALEAADYDVSWGAGGWTVRRLSDDLVRTFASLPATLDGFTLDAVSGTPAAGDRFLVRPGRDAASAFGVLFTDPARVAAAAAVRASAAAGNLGGATITPGRVTGADPDLAQPVTITFTAAGTFDVSGTGTGNPAGLAYTPGMTLAYNGWEVRIEGRPAAGDSFTVAPDPGGIGDNRNALAIAALQVARLAGGSATAGDAWGALVARVGAATHEAQVAAQAQASISREAATAAQAVSGVNLDEEAASLLRYQQAYQAAGKVIQTAAALFETLLGITNR